MVDSHTIFSLTLCTDMSKESHQKPGDFKKAEMIPMNGSSNVRHGCD